MKTRTYHMIGRRSSLSATSAVLQAAGFEMSLTMPQRHVGRLRDHREVLCELVGDPVRQLSLTGVPGASFGKLLTALTLLSTGGSGKALMAQVTEALKLIGKTPEHPHDVTLSQDGYRMRLQVMSPLLVCTLTHP